MKMHTGNSSRSRRGTLLVIVAVMMVGMAGLTVALLRMTTSSRKEQRQDGEETHARYVCQAGLSNAMYNLQRGQSGALGSPSSPVTWDKSQYYVTQTNIASDIFKLTATGIDDRSGARQELVVQQIPSTIWLYGLFGKESLHMDSNARADSFNSNNGTYATQATNGSGSTLHAGSNGDVGSNGSITLDSNAKIWGDAKAGPDHATVLHDNASVTGSITSLPTQMELPTISVPTYTSFGNLTVNANTTVPTGNRSYGTVRVKNNKTLTITGPASVVISNLQMDSNCFLNVDSTNGPVTLYVIDNFILDSNSQIYPLNKKPADLHLNILSDNVINPELNVQLDTLSISSNSIIYGTVFAPNARVRLDSNFNLYGSLIARSLDVDSNSFFHYDEALQSASGSGNPIFQTISWREVPYGL
jgi:hypothetical protein